MQAHAPKAVAGLEEANEKASTLTSELDPQEVVTWMSAQKQKCGPIDTDVRDAKRRINAVKPKRKKGPGRVDGSDGSSSDGGGA